MSEIKFNILFVLIFIAINCSLSTKIINTQNLKDYKNDSKCSYFSNDTYQIILNKETENNKKTNATLFIFFSSNLNLT